MRITSVELENIKSYRHAVVPLRPGTVAIRGMNGAGKSTLVEAIGFALFDALSYDQAKFVREGEKVGTVTIGFISALDGREYQAVRRCGTGATWYIYDPDLRARVAEQKADVTDFLRRHLRLDTEIQLRDLFTDALGVPQGTFTADFLLTPTNRKKKFDTLLQVEEYRKAAEKLAETRSYLQEQKHDQEQRIALLERDTANLDAWEGERTELIAEQSRLTEQLAAIVRESASIDDTRQALQQLSDEVKALEGQARSTASIRAEREKAAREADARLAEARAAERARKESAADHAAFTQAEQALAVERVRARERTAIQGQQSTLTTQFERARHEVEVAQTRLDEALAAEALVVQLRDAVTQQCDLEAMYSDAKRDVARLEDAHREHQKLRVREAETAREVRTLQQRLAALDPYRALADQRDILSTRLQTLLAAQAANVEQRKHLRALKEEFEAAYAQRDPLVKDHEKQSALVTRSSASQEQAERVAILDRERAEIERDINRTESTIERHTLNRKQSGTGLCPFFAEPCLNIQKRGENSLTTYFDRKIAEEEARLHPLRARLDENARDAAVATEAKTLFDQLVPLRDGLKRLDASLRDLDERLTRLHDEHEALRVTIDAAPAQEMIDAAQAEYQRAEKAAHALAVEPALRSQLEETQSRAARTAEELATSAEHIEGLAGAPAKLTETERALRELGNPRQRSATAEATARDRESRATTLAQTRERAHTLTTQLAEIERMLQPFVGVDATIQAHEVTLARTRAGHTRYLQFEQLATRLPEYLDAAEQATRAHDEARAAAERAAQAYAEATARFDPEALARVIARSEELRTQQGSLTQQIAHTQEATARLSQEIERAKGLLEDLRAAREELHTLTEMEQMLAQFRETIREAGPNIMRALLKQISAEANRIFGEILGDRSAQLSWEADYEIVLRRDGRERTFALLSGGEQMSAALAVRLALLRSLTRLDIAFFDEPTQNMDGERRGNLAEQIRRVRGFEQLVVISHDDTFEQGLDSVIYLEKRHGETVLVEDALVRA